MNVHAENERMVKDFTILGQNIRLKESDENELVGPDEVVDFVSSEIDELKGMAPNLDDAQIAVLLCLKFAKDKLSLEREYKDNIELLNERAKGALDIIEKVRPANHH